MAESNAPEAGCARALNAAASAESFLPAQGTFAASAFTHAPLCACVVDFNGHVVEANEVFEAQVGPIFAFAQRSFEQFGADEANVLRLKEALETTRSTGLRRRVRDVLCLATSQGFPVDKHFDWHISKMPCGSLCLMGDVVTQGDELQREKDAELIDFFQNAPIAMHWLGPDGIVLWANNTELRVLGYTAEEFIGQPIMKFCPDDDALVLEVFKTLGSGASIKDVPVRFRAKDGRIVPLLIDSNVNYSKTGEFKHTRCFIRDDTGRRVNEARAELMVQELKRSSEFFDAFVSRTLHLVRTPCHVMLANLDRLQEGELSESEASGVVAEVTGSLERVIGMTADVSDIMRFEQGAAMKVQRKPTDIRDLCRAAVDSALPLVTKGVHLSFDFAAGGDSVRTDSLVASRVLTHLLKNSARATASGSIVLKVEHSEEKVTFSVTDSGIGMDLDAVKFYTRYSTDLKKVAGLDLEAALDARSRVDADLRLESGTEGLGIGLSLSYCLVQSLCGELQGKSALGKGTRFYFDLPRMAEERGSILLAQIYRPTPEPEAAQAFFSSKLPCLGDSSLLSESALQAAAARASFARLKTPSLPNVDGRRVGSPLVGKRITRHSSWSAMPTHFDASQFGFTDAPPFCAPTPAAVAQKGTFEAQRRPHVLIVEDSPLCAKVLANMLSRAKCTYSVVGDGAQAVSELKASPVYDLVLMDLRMPVMDGFEAARIAKRDLCVSMPVVAVTAETGFSMHQRCSECGFDGLWQKPLKYNALLEILAKHVGANGLEGGMEKHSTMPAAQAAVSDRPPDFSPTATARLPVTAAERLPGLATVAAAPS
ncbi:hypothetical protein M885DRAFT_516864 [Pelagophyceae sp. CCMP2097]|nr:hypothetical protein M885DRAFT_516864 [Pelagophyceae sp. CCMP2097]|mmetsp:Transcript_29178/g.100714  ORF Transcript_29178/g.100714 Transcript_29178/m.100714 type:complete len:825 (-) Transcript_29178:201-2675(-)|eukprot:CAMPEP_0184274982 /NCGR_PEP_ID=MMETSP0977-20130417/46544_1 /TAXON_ID=483370 /ORGANISM="non described non described, Strain CCMP2097" /LENGTH=824 /DNA_ID=CAMNT_0026580867 /DNA_START=8 /DNA_END=2482 /DNA_ORIENTATION=+